VEALAADLERLAGERTPIGADALIDSLQAAVERASMALEEQGAMPATETRCAS
jgi:hypothetical protein